MKSTIRQDYKLAVKRKRDYTLAIKQSDAIAAVIFLLSFLHAVFLLAFLAFYLYRAQKSTEDAIRGLVLIALRTVLNPQIAVDISSVQLVKWLVIFAISLTILLRNLNKTTLTKVRKSANRVILFCVYICFAALISSSYPIVSVFKCFSYGFVFLSVLYGVGETAKNVDWADVLYRYLTVFMLCSILCSPFNFSYFSQYNWFIGVASHSQMFGIMAALYMSLLLLRMVNGKRSVFQYLMLAAVAYLTFLSGSRTGMISALLCVLYALYVEIVKNKKGYIVPILLLAAVFIWVVFREEVVAVFQGFIVKDAFGTKDLELSLENITMSRTEQYEMFLTKFQSHPLIGSGFMVPYVEGLWSWAFSFSLLVESGNLFYAVIGDLGILGLALFLFTYGSIYVWGSKKQGRALLFFAPLFINLGEMVFFSTNNNAIILYVMIAAFLVQGEQGKETLS